MAAPFVEGRLRNEHLAVEIRSRCAHCDRDITLNVDSELHHDGPPGVLVFEPRVDWSSFREPNIIRHY